MEVDVAIGSHHAHWFQWLWINLINIIRGDLMNILTHPRSHTFLVDDILDSGRHSCMVHHHDDL
jgi:hypothetical protein